MYVLNWLPSVANSVTFLTLSHLKRQRNWSTTLDITLKNTNIWRMSTLVEETFIPGKNYSLPSRLYACSSLGYPKLFLLTAEVKKWGVSRMRLRFLIQKCSRWLQISTETWHSAEGEEISDLIILKLTLTTRDAYSKPSGGLFHMFQSVPKTQARLGEKVAPLTLTLTLSMGENWLMSLNFQKSPSYSAPAPVGDKEGYNT